MPLALCSRVGPQNFLSSPDACDTIDWENEDIEHIGSLLNLFDEVGMLANESLSVFRLCKGADTSYKMKAGKAHGFNRGMIGRQ